MCREGHWDTRGEGQANRWLAEYLPIFPIRESPVRSHRRDAIDLMELRYRLFPSIPAKRCLGRGRLTYIDCPKGVAPIMSAWGKLDYYVVSGRRSSAARLVGSRWRAPPPLQDGSFARPVRTGSELSCTSSFLLGDSPPSSLSSLGLYGLGNMRRLNELC
ncbi:hypothetical protein GQ53DRAFT_62876 [Thozetella sp. PMI_491]|nr:hypothetical protein GQ53DRAFT_62876 [Thozetella sp. PMI_491]